jgi:GTP-binding protein
LKRLPRVAVVGRPNVGKSTLFNRITGGRKAIVDAVAGSTRDRNVATAEWGGRRFELVDTGGLFDRPETEIDERVAAQVHRALAEASVICWLVDGRAGVLPEDLALAERFRSLSDRMLLVVNKIDHPNRMAEAAEFYRLGFSPLVEVSAEHGLGVGDLLDEIVRRLPPERPEERGREEVRVAIVGRPNVGKSSLLNRLIGDERSVVSEVAGTTRDAVDTLLAGEAHDYRFVDTAGIRRPGKAPSRADRVSVRYAERAIERAHVCLLVLDATLGVTTQDAAIGGKIAQRGRGAIAVVNKWDLVESKEARAKELTEETRWRLHHLDFAPLAFVSALTGRGMGGLLPLVDRVREQQLRRIPTADLNRFLEAAVSHHPPRSKSGKEVKLLYITQSGVAPPRFVLFANRVEDLDLTYRRYLAGQLRRSFGFEGSPLRVVVRKKR